ncbi:hypothetical protein [Xylanibacter oryzae]|uniref:hypothetical protein n=1 Tax=Xylanibacter oryzae TaxID=185293 RepID=UPI0004B197A9|nr:hypothetical protein [Xylanibacter oryzae]
MKKNLGLIILFLISVCAVIGVFYTHEKTRNIPKSSDSIIVYFQTIFTTSDKFKGAKNKIRLSDRLHPNDTILLSHKDFMIISSIVNNRVRCKSDTIGVPEMYLKTKEGHIFLTRFTYYVTDDNMNPYIPNKEAIRRLYDICKIYNYFEKENIMYGKLYKKIPLDYSYYYAHKNGFANPEDRMEEIIAEQKKGIKLLLIDTYR